MAALSEVVGYLDRYLEHGRFKERAINGLQVETRGTEVKRVAYAVDAGLSVIEEAVRRKADLLVVHHGIFWGAVNPVRGPYARKLELLLSSRCSLFASHLPLDAHPEVGNNALLARRLGATDVAGFAEHGGTHIGIRGTFPEPVTLDDIKARTATLAGFTSHLVLPFGPSKIKSVGIVTGAGTFALGQCAEAGLDLFVSGEPAQQAYHEAKELGLNAVFAGHYATETLGVSAVAALLEKQFGVESFFIDEKTGI